MSRDEDVMIMARAISIDLGEDPDARDVLIKGRDGKRPHWEGFESAAEAALTALEASGRAVVPVEPTPEMLIAALGRAIDWMKENGVNGLSPFSEYPSPTETTRQVYSAMLAASPSPPMKGQKG